MNAGTAADIQGRTCWRHDTYIRSDRFLLPMFMTALTEQEGI